MAEPPPSPPLLSPGLLSLGEAPCSVNVHVTIAGRQVQVTLRGVSEEEVLTRLENVLARYPQTPAQTERPQGQSPAVQVAPPVCPYHGAMKASTKAPGTWYCAARMGDGSYCREKWPQQGKGR